MKKPVLLARHAQDTIICQKTNYKKWQGVYMVGSANPRTGLEEFIMREEILLQAREEDNPRHSQLTRKVTIRLTLHEYAAAMLLAARYDGSITATAQKVSGVALLDAAAFAGIPHEEVEAVVKAELEKINSLDTRETGGLRETLAAHGMELTPYEEVF